MMRLLVGLNLAAGVFLANGCSPSDREPDLSAILGESEPSAVVEGQDRLEFDFGSVLARDQTLRHEFRLANRSDRPLRVMGSKVKVPCCSSLGELPGSIEPGAEATIPVFLKVGHVSERKAVAFEIETDSPSRAVRTLFASARFLPDWEIQDVPGDRGPLKIGQSARWTYRAIARRKAGDGLRAPAEVVASGDVELESALSASEVESSDGLVESSRIVTVKLPGRVEPGDKSGLIAFRWPDGPARMLEVRWSVKPSLRLVPEVVVFRPGAGPTEVSVEVRSDDRPFRVVRVSGDLVTGEVPPSGRAETVQLLRIALDYGRVVPGTKPKVEIATDHPDQPTLSLGVLALPPSKRGME